MSPAARPGPLPGPPTIEENGARDRVAAPSTAAPRPTVLLVGGDIVGRAVVDHVLRDARYATILSTTAEHGLRRLASGQQPVSAAVLVGALPDGGAQALQRWIRTHGPSDLPIVGISADLDDTDRLTVAIDAVAFAADPASIGRALRCFGVTGAPA